MDSAVVLAKARASGFEAHALSFDYGQRHHIELRAAENVARALGAASHRTVRVDLRAIGGSALTDEIDVPKRMIAGSGGPTTVPITYVPARNMIFLSIACGLAEVVGAEDIFYGANAVDYSGYPDCREEFVRSFERTAALATRAGSEKGDAAFRIHAPLIAMSKADIVRRGIALGVDFGLTTSCYDPALPTGAPCHACDACRLRAKGFADAGVPDPALVPAR